MRCLLTIRNWISPSYPCDTRPMPKRSRMDPNSLAAGIVARVTGTESPKRRKNPHAVALGRKGGLVGGTARAKSLSPEERARIAKSAAQARWGKKG
jgi:hypothetical protein